MEAEKLNMDIYKQLVQKCLMHGVTSLEGETYVENRMKLYEDDFPEFFRDRWTPGAAAAAITMGY